MPRVLITTAWSPTKSNWFDLWSRGIAFTLKRPYTDLYITTYPAESKFASIVGAMREGQEYAIKNRYDFLFNVEADFALPSYTLDRLIEANCDVILPGVKPELQERGLVRMGYEELIQGRIGWGVMLVKVHVLMECPFSFHGDFLTPDRAWFKRVLQRGFEVWRDYANVEPSTGAHASPMHGIQKGGSEP